MSLFWTGRVFKAMEATQAELASWGGQGIGQGACGWDAAGREVVERKAREEAAGDLGCQMQASWNHILRQQTLKNSF